jgi:hypothetical protein
MWTGGLPDIVFFLLMITLLVTGVICAYKSSKSIRRAMLRIPFVIVQVVLVIVATVYIELEYIIRAGIDSL